MKQITRIDIESPGAYQPLLAGFEKRDFIGTPLILGYRISDMACGILLADCVENVAVLKWIAVDKNCQKRGIGGRLLEAFCKLVKEAEMSYIDAVVCLPAGEAKKADAFLEPRGFRQKESRESYSLCLETVSQGALSKLFGKKEKCMKALKEATSYQIRNYNQSIGEANEENFMPIVLEELLPESVVWIENDKIEGCVLLAPCGNGIELRMLSGNGSQMLALMLAKSCENLANKYPMDTKIYITTLVDSAKRLVEKLAGDSIVLEKPVLHYVKEWE